MGSYFDVGTLHLMNNEKSDVDIAVFFAARD